MVQAILMIGLKEPVPMSIKVGGSERSLRTPIIRAMTLPMSLSTRAGEPQLRGQHPEEALTSGQVLLLRSFHQGQIRGYLQSKRAYSL